MTPAARLSAAIEVIEATNLVTLLQKPSREVVANETRRARY